MEMLWVLLSCLAVLDLESVPWSRVALSGGATEVIEVDDMLVVTLGNVGHETVARVAWTREVFEKHSEAQYKVFVSPEDIRKSTYLSTHLLPVLVRHKVDIVASGDFTLRKQFAEEQRYYGGRRISFIHFGSIAHTQPRSNKNKPLTLPLPMRRFPRDVVPMCDIKQAVVLRFTNATTCPMVVALFEEAAPVTVGNWVSLVTKGFYNKTVFYRAEPGFVLQGGARTVTKRAKPGKFTGIPLEPNIPNKRGTLSMARSQSPNSATTEYFINARHNRALDKGGKGPGYAVFGMLVGDGSYDTLEYILGLPTKKEGKLRILNEYFEIDTATLHPYKEALEIARNCAAAAAQQCL